MPSTPCSEPRHSGAPRRGLLWGMKHYIQLFYSEHCFGCPAARKAVREFAAESEGLAVAEFDVDVDSSLARQYGVIATPAIVVDDGPVRYGVPTSADLRNSVLPP